jgi:PIN domain nuclease of toxin-antitoxin system
MGVAAAVKLLLDTHVWLWSLLAPERLRPEAAEALRETSNRLYLSPVSVWEAMLLVERGRVELKEEPSAWIFRVLREVPIFEAPLTFDVAIWSRALSLTHEDPADRFIAATARANDLVLLTADQRLLDCAELTTMLA